MAGLLIALLFLGKFDILLFLLFCYLNDQHSHILTHVFSSIDVSQSEYGNVSYYVPSGTEHTVSVYIRPVFAHLPEPQAHHNSEKTSQCP